MLSNKVSFNAFTALDISIEPDQIVNTKIASIKDDFLTDLSYRANPYGTLHGLYKILPLLVISTVVLVSIALFLTFSLGAPLFVSLIAMSSDS